MTRKNVPQTKNTARKSTAPRCRDHQGFTRPATPRAHPRKNLPATPRTDPHLHRRTKQDSSEMFARVETKLREKVMYRSSNYVGPVGLGIGKGGLKRIRQVVPRRKDIERCIRMRDNSIPLAPFARLIKSILTTQLKTSIRFQVASIEIMREAVEAYAIDMFETSNMYVQHARRVTVMCKDIALYKRVEKKRAPDVNNNGPQPEMVRR